MNSESQERASGGFGSGRAFVLGVAAAGASIAVAVIASASVVGLLLAVAVLVAVVAGIKRWRCTATRGRAPRGRLSWLTKWWLPFLWIILTPIVTVPLSVTLSESFGARHTAAEVGLPEEPSGVIDGWCPEGEDPYGMCIPNFLAPYYVYYEITPTLVGVLLPGLINLAPFIWALSKTRRTRRAGVTAGLAGVLRVAVPAMVLMGSFDRLTGVGGGTYFQVETTFLGWEPYSSVWVAGFFAWGASLALWVIFDWMTRERHQPNPTPVAAGDRLQMSGGMKPMARR